ncbi:tail fiber protein [Xenorhabdus bovienii]
MILSNDVGSDSETNSATPKAVKAAYDLANIANKNAK